MSPCLIIGDINFDHLVKVVHHKVAILPFVINVFLIRMRLHKLLETLQISCFSAHSSPLILVLAYDYCLQPLLTWSWPNDDFLFPSLLEHLLITI